MNGKVKITNLEPMILKFVDRFAKPLIVLSVALYLIEEEMSLRHGWKNSHESPRAFLWAERFIAVLFTVEFILRFIKGIPRWKLSKDDPRYARYPFSLLGVFDFIAIFPFWIGFFVPASWLGFIRTMRILRLLKFFRYSRSLQLTLIKFYRAYHNLKGIGFSIGIIWLFFAVMCLKLEQITQPENFNSLLDAAWFTIVTGTTVGYGDMFPIGTPGKIFVGLMLVPIIATIGACIAAVTAAFDQVQAEEDDPNVDPLTVFRQERLRQKRIKQLDREYRPME